ncbi:MAG: rhodanese-related sulfurtransferase [Haliscomenobacter sp.]|uniref:oxygen-dependent tRNA uridine(34) hydroxylase TrhO n=1 Tax=Haliscomenobacter sp. TaxID=2717303 RepID=UPI0029BB0ACE|nr:rhodanese-related sulfurtransferase [Haliscomenobacter sp.]MDX2067676.1 rhodanese-related sulfurtransferase [Haliscomenobacter sp.]
MKRLFNRVNNRELKKRLEESNEPRTTLSFYQYHQLKDPHTFRDELYLLLSECGVLGRIYVANEGINGQISVPTQNFEPFKTALYSIPWLNGIRLNIAVEKDGKSFFKLAIKVREKIVADGLDDATFDVTKRGKHLRAPEVNALLDKPETIVVDMRNHYESEVGYFEGAIRPDVETFREALPLVEDLLKEDKDKNIVMYCTGGIRCEKASAYYLHKGFSNVFMIDGGIIEYAHQCEEQGLPNKFIGKNFVFDERLGERISEDVVAHCHQCGQPCDTHRNCANDVCHVLFIQCEDCAAKYHACCSQECADFSQLPVEEQEKLKGTVEFNGTRFGKGRYRALRRT